MGAWKCNFPAFLEIMSNRQTGKPTEQPTKQRPGMRGHIEVTLPITRQHTLIKKKSMPTLISEVGHFSAPKPGGVVGVVRIRRQHF